MAHHEGRSNSVILMAAPNGARRTKADHPAIPVSVAEIAAEAAKCCEAGASAFHLHVRDKEGRHSLDPALYAEAVAAVRASAGADFFVQITTEAAGIFGREQQMAAARGCSPDGVSLAFREFVAPGEDGAQFAEFLHELIERGIAPQIILYTAPELVALKRVLDEDGLDPARLSLLYVLGRYSEGQTSEPAELIPFLAAREHLGEVNFASWMLCAFGPREHACAMAAALLGGHVRVGFENNLQMADGSIAPGTYALIAQAAGALRQFGLRPATPAEARHIFAAG